MRIHDKFLIGKDCIIDENNFFTFAALTKKEIEAAVEEEKARFIKETGTSRNLIFQVTAPKFSLKITEKQFWEIIERDMWIDENNYLHIACDDLDEGCRISVDRAEGKKTVFTIVY